MKLFTVRRQRVAPVLAPVLPPPTPVGAAPVPPPVPAREDYYRYAEIAAYLLFTTKPTDRALAGWAGYAERSADGHP